MSVMCLIWLWVILKCCDRNVFRWHIPLIHSMFETRVLNTLCCYAMFQMLSVSAKCVAETRSFYNFARLKYTQSRHYASSKCVENTRFEHKVYQWNGSSKHALFITFQGWHILKTCMWCTNVTQQSVLRTLIANVECISELCYRNTFFL